MLRIREFDPEEDLKAVDELDRSCNVGPSDQNKKGMKSSKKNNGRGVSLHVDQLGDPLCRVRHAPEHIMLVAEYAENGEIVGVIRACIKTVTRAAGPTDQAPWYVRVAYVLGLRVSPAHRRLGIGTKLVETVELWCIQNGAEYAYIATDRSNSPSLSLFTRRLAYRPSRFPVILTQPVHSHPFTLPPPSKTAILHLPPPLSIPLYRTLLEKTSEFFPSDIDSLLTHPLTLGTFLAVPSSASQWDPLHPPESFALLSIWNSKETLRLLFSGAPRAARTLARWTREADRMLPWLSIPSVRDVFSPFGVYIMYGMHMQGAMGKGLMRCLCRFVHNVAMEEGEVAAVVAEVGGRDPVREAVPHWRRFSCELEDVWCMKKLRRGGGEGGGDGGGRGGGDDGDGDDWTKSKGATDVMFVDPREF